MLLENRVISAIFSIIPVAKAAPIEFSSLKKTTSKIKNIRRKSSQLSNRCTQHQISETSTPILKEIPSRTGDQFQINTQEIGTQLYPHTAKFSDDSFVVVWKRKYLGVYSFHGQVFYSDGRKNGPELLLSNDKNLDDSSFPKVSCFGNDKFEMAWQFLNNTCMDYQGYRQLFSIDGKEITKPILIDDDGIGIDIKQLNDEMYVLDWGKNYFGTNPFYIIYQLLNASNFHVSNFTLYCMGGGDITTLDKKMLLTYSDYSGYLTGAFYDFKGSRKGDSFTIYDNAYQFGYSSAISILGKDQFVVTWPDNQECNILGQVFRNDSARIGTVFQVNSDQAPGFHNSKAKILGFDDYNFFVAWQQTKDADTKSNIFGQMFDINREKIGSQIKINTKKNEDASYADLTKLTNNKFIVVWQGDADIFAQFFETTHSSSSPSTIPWMYWPIGGGLALSVICAYLLCKKNKDNDAYEEIK